MATKHIGERHTFKKGPYPYGCSFMDIVCVTFEFEGSFIFNDRDRVFRVEEAQLNLHSELLDPLGDVAGERSGIT